MSNTTHGLVGTLMSLPIFQSEWVIWLLILLSLIMTALIIERLWFFQKHKVDVEGIRQKIKTQFNRGDFDGAATYLKQYDALETNVVLFGLRDFDKGPESVQDLIDGAMNKERSRYERGLTFMATIASNAPFIGLFGTVLGIIRAFHDLSENLSEASGAVMAGIAEALIATAVGLLVAIPAGMAFNYFKSRLKNIADDSVLLSSTLLAQLKALDASPSDEG